MYAKGMSTRQISDREKLKNFDDTWTRHLFLANAIEQQVVYKKPDSP